MQGRDMVEGIALTAQGALALCLSLCVVLLLAAAAARARARMAVRWHRVGPGGGAVVRASSLLGLAFSITSSTPPASPLAFPRQGAEPPWSWTGGFPSPPRPLVPARAPSPKRREPRPRRVSVAGAGAYTPDGGRAHPALHGRRRATGRSGERLFPSRTGRVSERARVGAGTPVATYRGLGRDSEVARAPGGDGAGAKPAEPRSCREGTHTVRPGETLWSIAGAALGTTDARRIARYWPRIHRINRALIGSTPDLIRPGWILRLPPECD
jgi:hypothetical protein